MTQKKLETSGPKNKKNLLFGYTRLFPPNNFHTANHPICFSLLNFQG